MVTRHVMSALVALPILQFMRMLVATSISHTKQGFFCDDTEIRYPDVGETIGSNQMHAIYFAISVLMTVGVEYTLIKHLTRGQGGRLAKGGSKIHPGLLNIAYFLVALCCSMLTTSTVTILGKNIVSRLRPNFLAVCKPNLTLLCPPNTFRYVDDYICYGEGFRDDEYSSFPSGHAAQSANFAVFIIYYLQKRCKLGEPIRPFLQLLVVLLTFSIALSRVRDHVHRLVDITAGGAIGFLIGTFFITYVVRQFRSNRYVVLENCAGENVYSPRRAKSHPSFFLPTLLTGNKGIGYQQTAEDAAVAEEARFCGSGYGTMDNSSSTENLCERPSRVVVNLEPPIAIQT